MAITPVSLRSVSNNSVQAGFVTRLSSIFLFSGLEINTLFTHNLGVDCGLSCAAKAPKMGGNG